MAIEITESYNYSNKNSVYVNDASNSVVSKEGVVKNEANVDLKPSQVVSGEILDISKSEVTLLLDKGETITALLDNSIELSIGQKLLFQVSSNGEQTALRPLYTNLNNTSAAVMALKEAGISVTATNTAMVSSMMDEGMSINRQALYSMLREVNANPNTNPATIVALNKLSLPVTELNIEQYENYHNFEHQILNDAIGLSEGITNLIGSSGNMVNGSELSFANDILSMIADVSEEWNAAMNNSVISGNAASSVTPVTPEIIIPNVPDNMPTVVEKVWEITLNPEEQSAGGSMNASVDLGEAEISENTAQMSAENQNQNNDSKLLQSLVGDLEKLGMSKEDISRINSGTYDISDLINFVKGIISSEIDGGKLNMSQKNALSDLLNNQNFKNILGDSILRLMQLSPEDVAREGQVEELYKRLAELSVRSIQILNENGMGTSEVMKNAQNINDNVDFMNQINQMMAYVQLPIRMSQENAHGELYVYTKKKNLLKDDGNVSALLHLDMENLGPMDIYVAMQHNKVNTNFYLKDEITLDLIEKNINLLNDRLTKKGYNTNVVVTMKHDNEPQRTIIGELLRDKSNGVVSSAISTKMSFDIRA